MNFDPDTFDFQQLVLDAAHRDEYQRLMSTEDGMNEVLEDIADGLDTDEADARLQARAAAAGIRGDFWSGWDVSDCLYITAKQAREPEALTPEQQAWWTVLDAAAQSMARVMADWEARRASGLAQV